MNSDAKRLTTSQYQPPPFSRFCCRHSTAFKRQSILPHTTTKQTEAHQQLGIYPHPKVRACFAYMPRRCTRTDIGYARQRKVTENTFKTDRSLAFYEKLLGRVYSYIGKRPLTSEFLPATHHQHSLLINDLLLYYQFLTSSSCQ